MSYTAKNLDEIAALFEQRALKCDRESDMPGLTEKTRTLGIGQAHGWMLAAHILRRTTLTEPCHMEPE